MGTSTARRAPTTRIWRLAKGAATRYLSQESPAPGAAREVVSRYVAALEEGAGQEKGGALAAFRLTRKIAQNFGDFCQQATDHTWQAALGNLGLEELAETSPEVAAHGLASNWVGAGGGLEASVVRTSLIETVLEAMASRQTSFQQSPSPENAVPSLNPPHLVKNFLTTAFYQRLVFDLGESLEAAADGWERLTRGLNVIRAEIDRAAATGADQEPVPQDWHGLGGWLWVSHLLKALLGQFAAKQLNKK